MLKAAALLYLGYEKEEYEQGEYICLESEEIVLQEKKTCIFDEKVKTKHGMRQFKTYKSPIFDDNEQLIGTVGIAHDVTDLEIWGRSWKLSCVIFLLRFC